MISKGGHERRHAGHSHGNGEDENEGEYSLLDVKRAWGCVNVVIPGILTGTPSLVDINGDGRLEIVYAMAFDSPSRGPFQSLPYKLQSRHVHLRIVTLEDAFAGVFGKDKDEVDFSAFLPPFKQPWSRYMGSNTSSLYEKMN